MRQDREHPLYYLDAETLLVAIYRHSAPLPPCLRILG